ncbi:MAG: FkbM family methyltransferase [Archaeoglobi archaeon]|nr:FkbM family methyltransferase [Archaeoglobi archaeon]
MRRCLVDLAKENVGLSWIMGLLYGVLMIPTFDGRALLIALDPRTKRLMKIRSTLSFDTPAFFHEIFQAQVYEREYVVRDGDIVVDCGAHVGMFTIKAAKRASLVISIEPAKENLSCLLENVRRHKLKNVIVVGKALSDRAGSERFWVGKRSGTSQLASISKPPEPIDHEEIVEVETLDNILSRLKVQRIDLLKVDVEGAELKVLRGAEESLKVTRNIAMELHFESERVRNYLLERGFDVKLVGNMLYAKKVRSP